MPTLRLQFPGGRYHATPWGHHVNEGLVEWPPSPWRLLRALIAAGFNTQGWSSIPAPAGQLIEKLASVLPVYKLPPVSAAHSRHYMPLGTLNRGREETTLVFDTWAHVGDGMMVVHWPCDLDHEEVSLLGRLAAAVGYLGRSESWVDARLLVDDSITDDEFNAFPHNFEQHPGPGFEQISLMAAIPPEEYRDWQQRQAEAALAAHPLPEGRTKPSQKLLKQRQSALAPYPPDLLSCLVKDTAWWKSHGWSYPPGSRRVLYWRPGDSLIVSPPTRPKRPMRRPVTTILLSLTTPSGKRGALPPCTRTVPQAELFHRAIVGRLGKGRRVDCPELTGRDDQGRPLREPHVHAHTLPVDLDRDGHLDHVIVYAAMGLGDAAQHAIQQVRETWRRRGPELQVSVAGYGDISVLRKLPGRLGQSARQLLGPPDGARVWQSLTPFVPPRYLKPRGKNSLAGQVDAELASRGLPPTETVHVDPQLTRQLRHYVRCRSRDGALPPMDVGFGLQLVFDQPVTGPLLLGYGAHFGLGMFRAVPSTGEESTHQAASCCCQT